MLAKKETKTQFIASTGKGYDTQEDAEYNSVRSMLGEACIGLYDISPHRLVELLKRFPDAMAWLVEQVGTSPVSIIAQRVEDIRANQAEYTEITDVLGKVLQKSERPKSGEILNELANIGYKIVKA